MHKLGRRISPRGEGIHRIADHLVRQMGIKLQPSFDVRKEASCCQIVRSNDQAGIFGVPKEIHLWVENTSCLVVVDEGLTGTDGFQVQEGLKALLGCVLEINSNNHRQRSTMYQEALKAIPKVNNTGFPDPSNRDIETIPVRGDPNTRVIKMSAEFGAKPNLKWLIIEHRQ
jgi:hypothetical protein